MNGRISQQVPNGTGRQLLVRTGGRSEHVLLYIGSLSQYSYLDDRTFDLPTGAITGRTRIYDDATLFADMAEGWGALLAIPVDTVVL